jgi:hypothetical protein
MRKCGCAEICNATSPAGATRVVTEWTAKKFKDHLERIRQIQADNLEAASSSMEVDSVEPNGNFIYNRHIYILCVIYKATHLFFSLFV